MSTLIWLRFPRWHVECIRFDITTEALRYETPYPTQHHPGGSLTVAANAAPLAFGFSSPGLNATGLLDVIGNQAVSGTGTITGTSLSGTQTLTLVTLATPGAHDVGGGRLSYRFGGGTDLSGDTFINQYGTPPIDDWGLVFIVGGPGHDGFNVWSYSATSFTGFLAGDALTAGGSIVYEGHDGEFGVPEPVTIGLLGVGLLGLAFVRRRLGAD